MDLRTALSDDPAELICSAKGCRRHATWALRWNNPKLHDAQRRKVWLACDEHEVTLRDLWIPAIKTSTTTDALQPVLALRRDR